MYNDDIETKKRVVKAHLRFAFLFERDVNKVYPQSKFFRGLEKKGIDRDFLCDHCGFPKAIKNWTWDYKDGQEVRRQASVHSAIYGIAALEITGDLDRLAFWRMLRGQSHDENGNHVPFPAQAIANARQAITPDFNRLGLPEPCRDRTINTHLVADIHASSGIPDRYNYNNGSQYLRLSEFSNREKPHLPYPKVVRKLGKALLSSPELREEFNASMMGIQDEHATIENDLTTIVNLSLTVHNFDKKAAVSWLIQRFIAINAIRRQDFANSITNTIFEKQGISARSIQEHIAGKYALDPDTAYAYADAMGLEKYETLPTQSEIAWPATQWFTRIATGAKIQVLDQAIKNDFQDITIRQIREMVRFSKKDLERFIPYRESGIQHCEQETGGFPALVLPWLAALYGVPERKLPAFLEQFSVPVSKQSRKLKNDDWVNVISVSESHQSNQYNLAKLFIALQYESVLQAKDLWRERRNQICFARRGGEHGIWVSPALREEFIEFYKQHAPAIITDELPLDLEQIIEQVDLQKRIEQETEKSWPVFKTFLKRCGLNLDDVTTHVNMKRDIYFSVNESTALHHIHFIAQKLEHYGVVGSAWGDTPENMTETEHEWWYIANTILLARDPLTETVLPEGLRSFKYEVESLDDLPKSKAHVPPPDHTGQVPHLV